MSLTDENKPPRWTLNDLFPSKDGPEFSGMIDSISRRAAAFAGQYKGRVAKLGGTQLFDAVREYETIDLDFSAALLAEAADGADNLFGVAVRDINENDVEARIRHGRCAVDRFLA